MIVRIPGYKRAYQGDQIPILEEAAINVGVRLVNLRPSGSGYAFTLGLQGELWRRRGPRSFYGKPGKRIAAVCYHGHAAFMRELFALAPAATLISIMERFDGVEDFKAKACNVGEKRAGPHETYGELCDCVGDLTLATI